MVYQWPEFIPEQKDRELAAPGLALIRVNDGVFAYGASAHSTAPCKAWAALMALMKVCVLRVS